MPGRICIYIVLGIWGHVINKVISILKVKVTKDSYNTWYACSILLTSLFKLGFNDIMYVVIFKAHTAEMDLSNAWGNTDGRCCEMTW
jgi:hypothetical protein